MISYKVISLKYYVKYQNKATNNGLVQVVRDFDFLCMKTIWLGGDNSP